MLQQGKRVEGQLLTGTIKAWECTKGYGFVSSVSDGGEDIFVHHTSVVVDQGRFPAITPGTEIQLTYHCRAGRDTGVNVTAPDGDPLPGYPNKNGAVKQIEGEPEPPSPGRKHGVIRYFNQDKGFGFIQPDKGGAGARDTFVHMNEVNGDFISLEAGERVEYNLGIIEGRYRAINVVCQSREQAVDPASGIEQQAQAATSVMYNPETGTYQYANVAGTQYGAMGGAVYVDPTTYGLQAGIQMPGQLSYMMPQASTGMGLSAAMPGTSTQLQPGQTFISNGQLYMMPPAQTMQPGLSAQSQVQGAQQYLQQATMQSYNQFQVPQLSVPKGIANTVQQQPVQYTQFPQYTSPIRYTQPLQKQQLIQPQQSPNLKQPIQPPQLPQVTSSGIQPGGYKRTATESTAFMDQPRKMFRSSG